MPESEHNNSFAGRLAPQQVPDNDIQVLIKRCVSGERKAQKALYDKYAPNVYGVIRRYTSHKELSDEILNDAFYKILTKIDQYSFKGSFEGWLYRIVVHTVTDHLRKYIKEKDRTDTREVEDNVHVYENIVERLSYKELLEMIHELPDTPRAVFNLYVMEQLSHKEIGRLLGITDGNSRWHLNSARKQLMEKIKNRS